MRGRLHAASWPCIAAQAAGLIVASLGARHADVTPCAACCLPCSTGIQSVLLQPGCGVCEHCGRCMALLVRRGCQCPEHCVLAAGAAMQRRQDGGHPAQLPGTSLGRRHGPPDPVYGVQPPAAGLPGVPAAQPLPRPRAAGADGGAHVAVTVYPSTGRLAAMLLIALLTVPEAQHSISENRSYAVCTAAQKACDGHAAARLPLTTS